MRPAPPRAGRAVGGSRSGRSLPTVRSSRDSGATRSGSTAESEAVVVSSSTLLFLVLTCPSASTPMQVSCSCHTTESATPLVTRVQRVKSTTPVYGGTFQAKTPVLGAPPQVTVTEATPFTESASRLTGAFSGMVCPSSGEWMVSVGPTPPSAGTLGSSSSRQAGSSRQEAARSTLLRRTVITDKNDPPGGADAT